MFLPDKETICKKLHQYSWIKEYRTFREKCRAHSLFGLCALYALIQQGKTVDWTDIGIKGCYELDPQDEIDFPKLES